MLPWLVILYFGVMQTNQYLEEMKQARQVSLSIDISLQIEKLIYELQKERGLTEGFLANNKEILNCKRSFLTLICEVLGI